ncbi:MAG: S8 family serine peptidase [Rhodospirillaceae bacterium]|nr:S8 family serine peptidase [Rhodospirillaceae bacterium]
MKTDTFGRAGRRFVRSASAMAVAACALQAGAHLPTRIGIAQAQDATAEIEVTPGAGAVHLVASFRGGTPANDIATFLELLSAQDLLPGRPYLVKAGDYTCRIFEVEYALPQSFCAGDRLWNIVSRLNESVAKQPDQGKAAESPLEESAPEAATAESGQTAPADDGKAAAEATSKSIRLGGQWPSAEPSKVLPLPGKDGLPQATRQDSAEYEQAQAQARDIYESLSQEQWARQLPADSLSLRPGRAILIPDLPQFEEFTFLTAYDLTDPDDKKQFENRQRNWKPLAVGKPIFFDEEKTAAFQKYKGYRLVTPVQLSSTQDLAILDSVAAELDEKTEFNASFMSVYDSPQAGKAMPYAVFDEARQVCEADAVEREEVFYGEEMGLTPDRLKQIIGQGNSCHLDCVATDDKRCPSVALVDGPLLFEPDIDPAPQSTTQTDATKSVLEDYRNRTPVPQRCTVEMGFKTTEGLINHHASYMAQIILAKPNSKGFLGIGPSAKLDHLYYDGSAGEMTNLTAAVTDESVRSLSDFNLIFSVATSFNVYPENRAPEGFDPTYLDTHRLERDIQSPDIVNAMTETEAGPALWSVAIGQHSSSGVSLDIDDRTPLFPQNHGDRKNVLLVTACEDCSGTEPKLWSKAYRSEAPMIAAPGLNIPGFLNPKTLVVADGTSQASAFVSGTAATMWSCWSGAYLNGQSLKTRLLTTAMPIEDPTEKDANGKPKIVSNVGVINPELALRDPKAVWIKIKGQSDYRKVKSFLWCEDVIEGQAPNATYEDATIVTRKIGRMVRLPSTLAGNEGLWIFHSLTGGGGFAKSDPQKLDIKQLASVELQDEAGGARLLLDSNQIQDLSFPLKALGRPASETQRHQFCQSAVSENGGGQ